MDGDGLQRHRVVSLDALRLLGFLRHGHLSFQPLMENGKQKSDKLTS